MRQEGLSRCGEGHAAGWSRKETCANLLFQLANLLAERRLGNAKFLGRARGMAMPATRSPEARKCRVTRRRTPPGKGRPCAGSRPPRCWPSLRRTHSDPIDGDAHDLLVVVSTATPRSKERVRRVTGKSYDVRRCFPRVLLLHLLAADGLHGDGLLRPANSPARRGSSPSARVARTTPTPEPVATRTRSIARRRRIEARTAEKLETFWTLGGNAFQEKDSPPRALR